MTQTLTTEQLRAHAESLGLDFFIERRAGILVKEWLKDGCTSATAEEVLPWSMLANREAQPVAEYGDAYQGAREDLSIWKRRALEAEGKVRHLERVNDHLVKEAQGEHRMGEPVFTALPAPAVPDDYQHLKNVQELYHGQEERLFAIAQRIKGASFDKYAYSSSQAIDVLAREIFGDDDDTCRAAMLAQPVSQGKLPDCVWVLLNHIEDVLDDESWSRISVEKWNAVTMLAAAPEGGNDA